MNGPTWSRHYQHAWLDRAGERSLPNWLRVACVAYGQHRANGHAMFRPGDLALILAHVDGDTGEVTPLDRRHLHRAIQKAVQYGWLANGSTARCLIVPAHAVTGGLGSATAECPQHSHRGRRLKAVS